MEVLPIALNMFADSDRELAFGITEFVSPSSVGFSGIVKKRYTDFQVFEITPDGEVVHLTDLSTHPKIREDRTPPTPRDHPSDHAGPSQDTHNVDGQSNITQANEPAMSSDTLKVENSNTVNGTSPERNVFPSPPSQVHEGLPRSETATGTSPDILVSDPAGQAKPEAPELSDPKVAKYPYGLDGAMDVLSPVEHVNEPAAGSEPAREYVNDLAQNIKENQKPQPSQLALSTGAAPSLVDDKQHTTLKENDRTEWSVRITPAEGGGWREMTADEEREARARDRAEAEENKVKGEHNRISPGFVYGKGGIFPHLSGSTMDSWNEFAGVKKGETIKLTEEDNKCLMAHFASSKVVEDLQTLFNHIMQYPDRQPKFYGNVKAGKIERAKRSSIHENIRRIFKGKLDSETDGEGIFVICAMPRDGVSKFNASQARDAKKNAPRSGRKKKQSQRNDNPSKPKPTALLGKYLHFTLFKENRETMAVISLMSKSAGRNTHFNYAGTKDRRGVTSQRVCVLHGNVNQVIAASKSIYGLVKVGNFEYRNYDLELGQLLGNEFHITLRDCAFSSPKEADDNTTLTIANAVIAQSVQALQQQGFLNYWGLQRFGTFGTSTDTVGAAMLKEDFAQAVDLILSYKSECLDPEKDNTMISEMISTDDRARAEGIDIFRTMGDARSALQRIPKYFNAERSIIQYLGRAGQADDHLAALHSIPRGLRVFYVHAYQSLVWNNVASERWRAFGSSVVEGDLVIMEQKAREVVPEGTDADGEIIVYAGAQDRSIHREDYFERARALSKEEAESGQYTIFDIVLPTPGYDIIYPANKIGKFYETFMGSERGSGLDPHNMRRAQKDYNLPGHYRKFAAKPMGDITFEVKAYHDEDEQLMDTDWNRLRKDKPEEQPRAGPHHEYQRQSDGSHRQDGAETMDNHSDGVTGDSSNPQIHAQSIDNVDAEVTLKVEDGMPTSTITAPVNGSTGSTATNSTGGVPLDGNGSPKEDMKVAVIIKMQLPKSTYATIALRELMKKGGMKEWRGGFRGGR